MVLLHGNIVCSRGIIILLTLIGLNYSLVNTFMVLLHKRQNIVFLLNRKHQIVVQLFHPAMILLHWLDIINSTSLWENMQKL